MIYRFQFRQSPQLILLPVIATLLIVGSLTLLVLLNVLLGAAALGISGWIAYHLIKFFRFHLRSEIRTSDDLLVCETSIGETTSMEWSSITHAGRYTVDGKLEFLFVYDESEDQLVSIPCHYAQITEFEDELRQNVGVTLELSGPRGGLVDVLKEHIGPEEIEK